MLCSNFYRISRLSFCLLRHHDEISLFMILLQSLSNFFSPHSSFIFQRKNEDFFPEFGLIKIKNILYDFPLHNFLPSFTVFISTPGKIPKGYPPNKTRNRIKRGRLIFHNKHLKPRNAEKKPRFCFFFISAFLSLANIFMVNEK